MKDHRWLVSALIEMHTYAERCDLDDVARSLERAIETVSPIVGGVPGGTAGGGWHDAGGQGHASGRVIQFPSARQRRSA